MAGRRRPSRLVVMFAAGLDLLLAGELPRAAQFTMLSLTDRDARLADLAVEAEPPKAPKGLLCGV
jgi:hypothetical protein